MNMLSQKHDLVLITNNTTRSPQQILSRLLQLGFEINPSNTHAPIMVTIDHLRGLGHKSGVPVVGEEIMIRLFNIEDIKTDKISMSEQSIIGLRRILDEQGITHQ